MISDCTGHWALRHADVDGWRAALASHPRTTTRPHVLVAVSGFERRVEVERLLRVAGATPISILPATGMTAVAAAVAHYRPTALLLEAGHMTPAWEGLLAATSATGVRVLSVETAAHTASNGITASLQAPRMSKSPTLGVGPTYPRGGYGELPGDNGDGVLARHIRIGFATPTRPLSRRLLTALTTWVDVATTEGASAVDVVIQVKGLLDRTVGIFIHADSQRRLRDEIISHAIRLHFRRAHSNSGVRGDVMALPRQRTRPIEPSSRLAVANGDESTARHQRGQD